MITASTHRTSAPTPRTLDPVEARLWRFALALTGDRTQATTMVAHVLASLERPGRRGSSAPPGEIRLMRAVALASRDVSRRAAPPFDTQANPDAAALWTDLDTLPRAPRIAWTIAHLSCAPSPEDSAFILGAPSEAFGAARAEAEATLGARADALDSLRHALTPLPHDALGDALVRARARAQRRWTRSGVLLVLAFVIFAATFGWIGIDLVSRDARDELERQQRDQAQRDFSNLRPKEQAP